MNKSKIVSFFAAQKNIIILIIIVISAFALRMEDLQKWKDKKEQCFYNGEPILTTIDGYYYLSLARDIAENSYHQPYEKRAVPDNPSRPDPPPLLSVIAAFISRLFSISLNWVGAILPPVLSLTIAVPIYLYGRNIGGTSMGISATMLALVSPFYIYRAGLGWFDTDCLNATLSLGIAYCFFKFGSEHSAKKFAYFIGGICLFIIFLWWWDSTPDVVILTTLVSFISTLIFLYRPSRKEGIIFYSLLLICALSVLLIKGHDYPVQIYNQIYELFRYISKENPSLFPNPGISIGEQQKYPINKIITYLTNNTLLFVVSAIGLLGMLLKKTRQAATLISLIILSSLSFFYAGRFILFALPVMALGFGFFISQLWIFASKSTFKAFRPAVIIICLLSTVPPIMYNIQNVYWPKLSSQVIKGLDSLSRITPQDSVIWAWWDFGYPIIYWSNRATISDGAYHGAARIVYNALPFAAHDPKFSANFIRFFIERGEEGLNKLYQATGNDVSKGFELMKKVLSCTPQEAERHIQEAELKSVGLIDSNEKWLRFFFPENHRNIYLFLDSGMIFTSHWWYWFGTYNIDKKAGIHPELNKSYENISIIMLKSKGKITPQHLTNMQNLNIDLKSGKATTYNGLVSLKKILINNLSFIQEINFHQTGSVFYYLPKNSKGFLQDADFANSTYNRLFLGSTESQFPEYFKPVELNTPIYQIWQVM